MLTFFFVAGVETPGLKFRVPSQPIIPIKGRQQRQLPQRSNHQFPVSDIMNRSIGAISRACRSFHINTPGVPAESVSSSASPVNSQNLAQVYKLPKLNASNELKLEIVGDPPSAASLVIPPSLPVNIRRGSLLALQGNPSNVSMTPKYLNAAKRLLYGNLSSRYTLIVSTETIQMLVSARAQTIIPRLFRNTTPRAFASITLDGKSDWALIKRDALQVYGGSSLVVETVKIPQKISRQLAKALGSRIRANTGLFSWLRPGYTFVGGRGIIGVVGNGLVYSVDVAEGEEFAVNKSCLVGFSVNGPKDIQNVAVKHEQTPLHVPAVIMPPPKVARMQTRTDVLINLKHYSWLAAKAIKDAWLFVRRHTSETPGFIRIVGPRTVLVQSGEPFNRYERSFQLASLESYGVPVPANEGPVPRVAADYLNTVTVGPRGTTIESTESFVKR